MIGMAEFNPDYVGMFNGRAVYARYKIIAEIPADMPADLAETLCLDERMKEIHLKLLADLGITKVQAEEIPEPPEMAVTKENGEPIMYESRTEILEHLLNGREPKSLEISRLKERLAAAEQRVQQAEARAQAAKQKAEAAVNAADMLAIEIESLKKERG